MKLDTGHMRWRVLAMMMGLFLLCGYAYAQADQGFLAVTGPCFFSFPRDHGAHPGYRTEWWYYTGNLFDADQHAYGFQLTFFRRQISPPREAQEWPVPASAWRTQQIYLAHAAVSDISGKMHLQAQDVARNALGMAGVDPNGGTTRIHLKNWSATISDNLHEIRAKSDSFAFQLNLSPAKPPVFHGQDGYSRKGYGFGRASCYYSFTRLNSEGTLTLGGKSLPVKGLGWMDHEFSTAPLEPGILGWDWFSLQLSDRTEIMVFLLREPGGGLHAASSGTFVEADGRTLHLAADEFKINVRKTWQSKKSQAIYPAKWEMALVPLSIYLDISSNLADQEMQTRESTGIVYWEGSISCRGKRRTASVTGSGYAELTGYAQAFDAGP